MKASTPELNKTWGRRQFPSTTLTCFVWMLVTLLGFSAPTLAETVGLYFDAATPQIAFAAGDIKAALEKRNVPAKTYDLAALAKAGPGRKIVLAVVTNKTVAAALSAQGGKPLASLGEQPEPLEQQPERMRTTKPGTITMTESLAYNFSLPVATNIVGVDNVAQLEEDVKCAANFVPLSLEQMRALEERTLPIVRQGLYFRRWDLGA